MDAIVCRANVWVGVLLKIHSIKCVCVATLHKRRDLITIHVIFGEQLSENFLSGYIFNSTRAIFNKQETSSEIERERGSLYYAIG